MLNHGPVVLPEDVESFGETFLVPLAKHIPCYFVLRVGTLFSVRPGHSQAGSPVTQVTGGTTTKASMCLLASGGRTHL